jgi:hypothetical protein
MQLNSYLVSKHRTTSQPTTKTFFLSWIVILGIFVLQPCVTMVDLLFISSNPSCVARSDADHKRAVRSHAMKDFRRRQREGDVSRRAYLYETLVTSRVERNKPHATKRKGINAREDIRDRRAGLQKHNRHAVIHPASTTTGQDLHTSIESTTTMSIPESISSSLVSRMPLLQAVVEGFFPQSVWKSRALEEGFKYWAAPRSLAMQQINDSVGLLQLGINCGEKNLKFEGQRRQLLAVQLLNNELREGGIPSLTAAHATITLMVSEVFAAVSSGASGYIIHLAGLTSILEAQVSQLGAHTLNANVLKHYSRLVLMQALIDRRAIQAGQARLTNHMSFAPGTVEALLVLALRVPYILESTDLLRSERPEDRARIAREDVWRTATCLHGVFNNWFINYELRQNEKRFEPCNFHSFLDANALCLYWCLRLLLLECLESLDGLAGTRESHGHGTMQQQTSLESWSKQADTYASLLLDACQATPNFKGSALSIALCIRAPFHFARSRWSRFANEVRSQEAHELECLLRLQLQSFDWDVLLYWSFFPLPWLA